MSDTSSQFSPLDASRTAIGEQKFSAATRLFGLDRAALQALMTEIGEPAFRGRQLAEALYRQRLAELDQITTLPKSLRQKLTDKGWQVGRPRIDRVFQSTDGTERYLIQCPDAENEDGTVEAVWMPGDDDSETDESENSSSPIHIEEETAGTPSKPGSKKAESFEETEKSRNRGTICVSSQIGCAVNCQFCLTARLGFQRNLTAGEIAGQIVEIFARHKIEVGRDRLNLVFMGMGEPFLNYENFMAAVHLLVHEVGLSPLRMTVSTSGIVPGIERFATEPNEIRPKLAISLNAPNDAIRDRIMPLNRKWPIRELIDAARGMNLRPHERITFEYVLLGGVTDQPEHAAELARLLRRSNLPAKVNLIAWNAGPDIDFTAPAPASIEKFRRALTDAGIPAYLRKSRGRDIYAACGQLKRTLESPSASKERPRSY
jgi:23S rRNA (adenine2503-C2)-methyltransferase